jgi:hypothetical protein
MESQQLLILVAVVEVVIINIRREPVVMAVEEWVEILRLIRMESQQLLILVAVGVGAELVPLVALG